ncbi:putative short chain dehydrogenase/reductase [Aspergillus ambiguus]|uniref:putative short chain dehydrogenase/reductase n=1 Tax=Aspergillus ambiguus TaxID=176160 RepID=UPI003CCCDE14
MTGLVTYRNFSLDDVPPLTGKVAVVTGGQGGIGKEITAQLLLHDIAKVFIIARNADKYLQAQEEWRHRNGITLGEGDTRTEFVKCDLADIVAVNDTAEYIQHRTDRLDILICNGGIGISTEYNLSPQNIEAVFAANCVGHHRLTTRLLPLLKQTVTQDKSSNARIVITSSSLHTFCRKLDFGLLTTPTPPKNRYIDGIWRYARSKLGNILFTRELNRRLFWDADPASRRIYVNTFFPGNIVTDQWNVWNDILGSALGALMRFVFRLIGQRKEDGAATAMYLAASRNVVDEDLRGGYFIPVATPDTTTKIASDMELAHRLWEWTEAQFTETLSI